MRIVRGRERTEKFNLYTFWQRRCSVLLFFYFFFSHHRKTILRSAALLFNFQSQKSLSVLVVYKNLTHLHTNKNPAASFPAATRPSPADPPRKLFYI